MDAQLFHNRMSVAVRLQSGCSQVAVRKSGSGPSGVKLNWAQSIEWGFWHWGLRRAEMGKITVQKFFKRRYRSGLWAELVTGEIDWVVKSSESIIFWWIIVKFLLFRATPYMYRSMWFQFYFLGTRGSYCRLIHVAHTGKFRFWDENQF